MSFLRDWGIYMGGKNERCDRETNVTRDRVVGYM